VLLPLPCRTDTATGNSYVRAAPYAQCETPTHRNLVGASIALMIIYLAGFPVLIMGLLYRFRNELKMPWMYNILGFMYRGYTPGLYWWELVVLFRKLALVVAFFVPDHHSFVGPLLAILVLQFSIVLQLSFKPYNTETQNFAEVVALYTLQVTYTAGLIIQVDWIASDGGFIISSLLLLFNLLTIGYFVYTLSLSNPTAKRINRELRYFFRRTRMEIYYRVQRCFCPGHTPQGISVQEVTYFDSDDEATILLDPEDVDKNNYAAFPERAPAGQNMFLY